MEVVALTCLNLSTFIIRNEITNDFQSLLTAQRGTLHSSKQAIWIDRSQNQRFYYVSHANCCLQAIYNELNYKITMKYTFYILHILFSVIPVVLEW